MRCIQYISASFLRRRQPQTWAAKRLQRWFRHRRLGGRSSFNRNMKDFEIRGLVDLFISTEERKCPEVAFYSTSMFVAEKVFEKHSIWDGQNSDEHRPCLHPQEEVITWHQMLNSRFQKFDQPIWKDLWRHQSQATAACQEAGDHCRGAMNTPKSHFWCSKPESSRMNPCSSRAENRWTQTVWIQLQLIQPSCKLYR